MKQSDIAKLKASHKFRSWRSQFGRDFENGKFILDLMEERHFSASELAKLWGVSTELVRSIFRAEPGVLKIVRPATRYKRGYATLRIPESVAERVHQRLSA